MSGFCRLHGEDASKPLIGEPVVDRPYNVLFLCTGNSAHSILAEALINQWGRGRFQGFSAGSHPKWQVHPIALELLKHMKLPTEGLRSKSWDEFAVPEAAPLDFVFTVCDNAAGEVCPYWLSDRLIGSNCKSGWMRSARRVPRTELRESAQASHSRGNRLAAPGGDRNWLGRNGRAPGRGQRRNCASR